MRKIIEEKAFAFLVRTLLKCALRLKIYVFFDKKGASYCKNRRYLLKLKHELL